MPGVTPLTLNPAPVTVTLEMVIFEFPLFVSVAFKELVPPTFTFPNPTLVGFAPSSKVGATPIPLRGMAKGELGALLTSEAEPVTLPVEVGANTTLNVLFPPAAIVNGTVKPVMLKPVPETLAREIVTPAVPLLVNLMVCELLVPVITFPKLAVVGVAASCG